MASVVSRNLRGRRCPLQRPPDFVGCSLRLCQTRRRLQAVGEARVQVEDAVAGAPRRSTVTGSAASDSRLPSTRARFLGSPASSAPR